MQPTPARMEPEVRRIAPNPKRLSSRSRPYVRAAGTVLVVAAVLIGGTLSWRRAQPRTSHQTGAPAVATLTLISPEIDPLATAYAKALTRALHDIDGSGEARVATLYRAGKLSVDPRRRGTGALGQLTPFQQQRTERIVDALDPVERQRLMKDELQLYKIELRDSEAEDFDIVMYEVDGHTIGHADLRKATREVLVPVTRGRAAALTFTGVFDGGGGITLEAITQQGQTFLGVLGVGERVTTSVRVP